MLSPSDYTSSFLPTAAEVRAYVNTADPIIDVYAELLNARDLTPKNSMPDGTNVCSLHVIEASIENNMQEDVPRSMTLVLDGTIAPYVDFTCDRIRLSAVYLNPDRSIKIGPIPRGIFGFQQTKEQFFDNGETYYTVTGYDDVWDFTLVDFLADYVIPRGFDVGLCAATIAMMDMYSPSEGGRAPSGTPAASSPQATLPIYTGAPYASFGVSAASVCTQIGTGYLQSPAGIVGRPEFNPYDTCLVDNTIALTAPTWAPISPLSGQPMQVIQYPDYTPEWWSDPALGLYFQPRYGAFATPFVLGQTPNYVNPFTGGQVNVAQYIQPDETSPIPITTAKTGTVPPPLSTWPYDEHGVKYFTTPTATIVTTTTSGPGPALLTLPIGNTIGQRSGVGYLTIPASTSTGGVTGVSVTDPAAPGQTMLVPATSPTVITGPDISGWVFATDVWTVALVLQGTPGLISNGMSVDISVQENNGGTITARGTLASTGSTDFDASGNVTLTCSGSITGFTGAAGSKLQLVVTLVTSDWVLPSGGSASVNVGSLTVNPASSIVPPGSVYTDPGTGGTATSGTTSATKIAWPDSNNPGLCPSSCETPGCDFPAWRVNFPMGLATTMATVPYGRASKHLAALHGLFDGATFYHVWQDEFGVLQSRQKPYYTSSGIPTREWTFSNDSPLPDGDIITLERTVFDLSAAWNIEFDVSLGQGAGSGLVSKRTNDDPASPVSRAHMKRPATHVMQNDKIVVQTQLDDMADAGLQQGSTGTESVKMVTSFNPFFQSYDTINIKWLNQLTGLYTVDGTTYPYVVTYWKQTLKSQSAPVASMDVTAERTVVFV